jgi:Fic family protein
MARGRPSRATIHARLDAALNELHGRLGGLPSPKESETIWSDIWHLEAHHSTALEGNTLVLREVSALLEQKRAVGAKPLKEYMEVQGYGEAARWVYEQALEPDEWNSGALISLNELRRIHFMAMTPVWGVAPHPDATNAETPGNFREHDIHPFNAGMTPPAWLDVPAKTADWINEVVALGKRIASSTPLDVALPEALARLHNDFERVHPFIDGNGRTGRLALNLILVRLGYPPVIIFKKQRESYLNALQKSDDGDHGPLGEIIARAMLDNLMRFIVPNVAGPARMVPLAALVDSELTVYALRQAAQRGRLDAQQGGDGIWRSSRKAVEIYKQNKQTRRPTTP